ncbi:hypothetical protein V490_02162 [Pseudogymnoascus sp. VKM F-3557]|nr:hypothetical protein V490_02162 [Pseudogymnoascus sp. VKM F-3557]
MDRVKAVALDTPSIALSTLSVLAIYFCFHLFQTAWRLRHIPGPFWARFTNIQRALWVKTMRSHEIHQEAHQKYGNCVRMGPNMVSIDDPAAIPTLYPMRRGFTKSLFYRGIMPYTNGGALPAIFTTQDEQQHKDLKTPVAAMYSQTNVITFEPFVDEVLAVLFDQLNQRFVKSQARFDLGDWLQYFAFDVMGTMTFSKRYGFLETGTDVNGMLDAIWQFMLTIAPMTQIPLVDRIWYKSPLANLLGNQVAVPILKIVSQNLDERQAKGGVHMETDADIKNGDFLSRFMKIQATNSKIPSWSSRTWTFSNVIAGSDSSSSVMRTAMFHILANPATLYTLNKELRAANLTLPYPKWNEVRELPYLDACINEAVRVHPPFCLPLERVAPEGGVVICGQHFPQGTCIGMNPYVVNRHKPTFGEDADLWRPERWMVGPAERKKLEGSIMTFGAGRRTCLGKHIALLEIKKVVPALLLNYDINLLDANTYFVENSYFFRQEGIDVTIQKRDMTLEV